MCIRDRVYTPDNLVSKKYDPKRFKHFSKLKLKISDYIKLAKICKKSGKDFSASIWDKNLIKPFKNYVIFYNIGSGIVWVKVGSDESLIKALSLINYYKIKTTKTWEGIGIATYGELTGIGSKISVAPGMPLNTGSETSILEIDSTGSISATFGIASHGQGLETTLSQVVGDHLGVTPNSIKIKQGNTSLITHGTGTYASRSAALAGGAAIKVSKKAKNHILKVASFILNVPKTEIDIEDNFIVHKNSNKKLSFPELAKIIYSDMQTLPIKLRTPLIFVESYDPIFGASTCLLYTSDAADE